MKGSKAIRIVLGVLLLILLAIYLYMTGSARANGDEFDRLVEERKNAAIATPSPEPAEPSVQPEESAAPEIGRAHV